MPTNYFVEIKSTSFFLPYLKNIDLSTHELVRWETNKEEFSYCNRSRE